MNLNDFFSAMGSLAFTCAILTVSMFIINYKFKDQMKTIFHGKFNHLQLHKILGLLTIFLATIHGIGMLFVLPNILKKIKGQSGLLTLIIFFILVSIPFINKKIPLKYKRSFFKLHKILGIIIFIFILIHIFL